MLSVRSFIKLEKVRDLAWSPANTGITIYAITFNCECKDFVSNLALDMSCLVLLKMGCIFQVTFRRFFYLSYRSESFFTCLINLLLYFEVEESSHIIQAFYHTSPISDKPGNYVE